MKLKSLVSIVLGNARRSKKNFVMSSIGIIVGISSFVFFIGLGEGVKDVVLGKVFLIDHVEVAKKKFNTGLTAGDSLFGLSGRPLDDSVVKEFQAIEGVAAVYPKMKFTFPTRGYGGKALFGREVWAEIIADGIKPALVTDDLDDPNAFQDFERERSCTDADASLCMEGEFCHQGKCTGQPCDYNEATRLTSCPGDSYCVKDLGQCQTPIPVIVSNYLLELYNGSLSTALSGGKRKLPKLSKTAVKGFQLNLTLGKSFLGRSPRGKPLTRRVKLVGFSNKAITMGITMPIGYVQRLNAYYSGGNAGSDYHSVVIKVKDQQLVPAIVAKVKEMNFDLAESTDNAEKAAKILKTVESVFALVSFVIVGIAAINISQMFFMLIYQRKREIGVLRAVGASRNDVRMIILGEAAVIGVIGGIAGAAVGFGASRLIDAFAANQPEFPFKPDSFFVFPAWLWAAAVGGSVLFCLIGAFLPANAAARQEPAEALTQ